MNGSFTNEPLCSSCRYERVISDEALLASLTLLMLIVVVSFISVTLISRSLVDLVGALRHPRSRVHFAAHTSTHTSTRTVAQSNPTGAFARRFLSMDDTALRACRRVRSAGTGTHRCYRRSLHSYERAAG